MYHTHTSQVIHSLSRFPHHLTIRSLHISRLRSHNRPGHALQPTSPLSQSSRMTRSDQRRLTPAARRRARRAARAMSHPPACPPYTSIAARDACMPAQGRARGTWRRAGPVAFSASGRMRPARQFKGNGARCPCDYFHCSGVLCVSLPEERWLGSMLRGCAEAASRCSLWYKFWLEAAMNRHQCLP